MKQPYLCTLACSAAISLLMLSSSASAAPLVDQSQLDYNTALVFAPDIGQSFQAGISGQLADIEVFSNGSVQGGSNALTVEIFSGDTTSGTPVATLTKSVSNTSGNVLDINTQSLNFNVTAGHEYTFDIVAITGTGDLSLRGLLADGIDSYSQGQVYNGGSIPGWDLAFQTLVNPVPIPASVYLFAAGLFGISRFSGKKNTA